MPPKADPKFPCLRCKKNVGKVEAISCNSCKGWVHRECEDMADNVFALLAQRVPGIVWHCASCLASTARIDPTLRQLDKKITEVDERVARVEEREKGTESRLTRVEESVQLSKTALDSAKDDITKVLLEEMREREEKKLNIVIHSVGEVTGGDAEGERRWNKESFNNVMHAMKVNLNFRNVATFSRRLGARREDRPRPLLVGLKREADKDMILANAKHLNATHFRNISVVPDLTRKQREADDNTRREADRKNKEELTAEDKAKNMQWVAVGRKGARRVVKKEQRPSPYYSHPQNQLVRFPGAPRQTHTTLVARQELLNSRKRTLDQDSQEAAKKQRQGGEVEGEEMEDDGEEPVFLDAATN